MAKRKTEYELLAKRIELLEMQVKELTTVEPEVINERLKSIEETLYTTKDILNMKKVCQYLGISQSLLYKLTCSGEIPHFKPRGKMIFFEKKELIEWIKKGNLLSSEITKGSSKTISNDSTNYEEYEKELEVYKKAIQAAENRWSSTLARLQGRI